MIKSIDMETKFNGKAIYQPAGKAATGRRKITEDGSNRRRDVYLSYERYIVLTSIHWREAYAIRMCGL